MSTRKGWQYANRWALVTGASSGLGDAFARTLAARGMNLVLTARREERLRALAEELERSHGAETVVVAGDLAASGAPARVWEEATEGRHIHLLVNNAGFGAQGRFDEVPLARQMEMVRVNVVALLELMHRALPPMRVRGEGGVINVASIAAFQPVPAYATYGATKAFVQSLSEAAWAENRDAGVRILALAPGRTPTEFQEVAGSGSLAGSPGVLPPDEVVRQGLVALERERSHIVPGLANAAGSVASRLLPRGAMARITGWVSAKL